MSRISALAIALALSTPAGAKTLSQRIKDLPDEEWVFQGLNIADKAITNDCLRRGICQEKNPFLGRNPSTGKMIAAGVAEGVAHAAGTMWFQDHAPGAVKLWEISTITVGAGVVGWNLRVRFR